MEAQNKRKLSRRNKIVQRTGNFIFVPKRRNPDQDYPTTHAIPTALMQPEEERARRADAGEEKA